MTLEIVLVFILLELAHFVGDFTPLSTPHMLEAKSKGSPLLPIWFHASVHGTLMLFVMLFLNLSAECLLDLTLLQIVSHFLIDTLKGKLNVWFPIVKSPANSLHWIVFGADQFLHHTVIIFMTYIISNN